MSQQQETTATVKMIGSNGQISLGKRFAGRRVLVEEQEAGVWLVRTATIVPDNERWLHEPENAKRLKKAIAWAEANPSDSSNVDEILDRLNAAD
jgi:hypothetical protein